MNSVIICRYACAFTNCPEYGRTWTNKYGVYSHWQSHHIDSVENPVQCTVCPKKLVSTVMLKMHMQSSHYKLEGKKFSCSVCGIIKGSQKLLRVHESIHQSSKSFSCEFCDFTTNTRHNKNAHIRYS